MSSSITITDDDKARFDELFPDATHKEAFGELLAAYETLNGDPVDTEQLAQELRETLVSDIEVACYRGVDERLSKVVSNE